jgi:hypothetical protein
VLELGSIHLARWRLEAPISSSSLLSKATAARRAERRATNFGFVIQFVLARIRDESSLYPLLPHHTVNLISELFTVDHLFVNDKQR